MHNKMKHLMLVSILLVQAIVLEPFLEPNSLRTKAGQQGPKRPVSMCRLLANPEAYDGKEVLISGYLHYFFEDSAIYLTKDDADHLDMENAIWISSYKPDCTFSLENGKSEKVEVTDLNGRRVSMIGTVDASNHGHFGMFAGSLKDVKTVSESRRWYDGGRKIVETKKNNKIRFKRKTR